MAFIPIGRHRSLKFRMRQNAFRRVLRRRGRVDVRISDNLLTGVGASTQTGAARAGITLALTGIAATAQVGTLVAGFGALSSVSASAAIGTIATAHTRALTGTSVSAAVGSLSGLVPGAVVLSGVAASAPTGFVGVQGEGARAILDTTTYAGTTIGGSDVALQPRWSITAAANATGTLHCSVLSSDGSYAPTLDMEIVLTENGVRIFGGFIQSALVRGANNEGAVPLLTEISAVDFNVIASRRYYNGTIPAGTLKQCLEVLLPYLQEYGVVLDPAQLDGPSLPGVTYNAWKVNEILNQLTNMAGGYIWEIDYYKVLRAYVPGSKNSPYVVTIGSGAALGDVTSEPQRTNYANRVWVYGTGVFGMAQDATEISEHGVWELAIRDPDMTTQTEVDTLATSALAASLPITKIVKYQTALIGAEPGQTQTITLATRNVNNTFLIRQVRTQHIEGEIIRRFVEAIEGTVYQTGWREVMKTWGGSGGITAVGAGNTGGGFSRPAYPLQVSGYDFVQSPTPTWVFASPMQVQLNTVARGTTAAVITGRLRALTAGVSVKARLFDTTDQSACSGESALVVSTEWTNVQFSVILNPGSHFYMLQLLPGTANEDVGFVGYVE